MPGIRPDDEVEAVFVVNKCCVVVVVEPSDPDVLEPMLFHPVGGWSVLPKTDVPSVVISFGKVDDDGPD